jgi:molecular chaperone GrpE (heat shock protein)
MMRDQIEPKLSKLPFYFADALLLGAALFIYNQSPHPLGAWQTGLIVLSVACGAWISVLPFVLEYRAKVKVAEAGALTTVVAQIQNMESIAAQISGATGQWQTVQEQASQTAVTARQITERMAAEAKGFAEFVQRANDGEKANLRLEVEKLRRAEADWLQVLVRMLDHVYALHQGAVRSQQASLIEQVSHFQNACRDAARRVGLSPFIATDSEPFDAQRHQLIDGNSEAGNGSAVAETIAAGYTFQGKLVRPALVRLQTNGADATSKPQTIKTSEGEGQSQLPLETAGAGPG